MKFFSALLVVLLTEINSGGQTFPFDLWHQGKVILDTGDTLTGLIKYDREKNFLQINNSGKAEVYNSAKVVSFEIFDLSYKRQRQFFSLPYAEKGDYKAPYFFELVTNGKITLLSREDIQIKTTSTGQNLYPPKASPQLVNKYFLLKENGDIEPFAGKNKDWYELMRSRESAMHDYVKKNDLDFDKKYQLKQIIDYYNSFFNPR